VGANGKQIKLDGVMFLDLTLGGATTRQMVYMTHRVTRLFLFPEACKELHASNPDFLTQPATTVQVAECTPMDSKNDNDHGFNRPAKSEEDKETLAMLESGKRALLMEDVTTACNNLAMCGELMAEEHGELSENCAEVYHK
jgi:hypothetical protein